MYHEGLVVFNVAERLEVVLRKLRIKQSTLLGISPISKYVLTSGLKVADRFKAPMLFVASLNQVDVDGGYTGFTPSSFVKYVNEVIKKYDLSVWIVFQVDHCGPWLKDDHVLKNYSYNEALNAVLKSLEEFVKAGFSLFHIDTTLDLEKPDGVADVATAVERTVQLIDLAEDCRSKSWSKR